VDARGKEDFRPRALNGGEVQRLLAGRAALFIHSYAFGVDIFKICSMKIPVSSLSGSQVKFLVCRFPMPFPNTYSDVDLIELARGGLEAVFETTSHQCEAEFQTNRNRMCSEPFPFMKNDCAKHCESRSRKVFAL
jgi:hypothetical protein